MNLDGLLKICTKCGENKQYTDFSKCKRNKSGVQSQCKACKSTYHAADPYRYAASNLAWAKANPGKRKAAATKYRTKNPEKCKEATRKWQKANPERHKDNSAAWAKANPDRRATTYTAWRAANKEHIAATRASHYKKNIISKAAYGVAWRKRNLELCRIYQHNRRARELESGGKLSNGLAAKLFKLQKGKCPCCNKPLGNGCHMDHIKPLSMGGTNTDDNIQLLRATCNLSKSAKDPFCD